MFTGAMFGALAGWLVEWLAGDCVVRAAGLAGVHGFVTWEIGLVLGFVGGAFRGYTVVRPAGGNT